MSKSKRKDDWFAMLPGELLMHSSVTTLSHAAFRVLTIMAAGYRGRNNGALSCTDSWMKRFGISSKDTTYRSLHELAERGLIEITRPGIKHRKIATLYAITWQELNSRNGEILGRFSPATHAYRQWQPPAKVKKKVPDRRKVQSDGRTIAEFQSDGRTSTSPMVGPEKSICSPMVGPKVGGLQSDGREYLRISDGFSDSASGSAPDPSDCKSLSASPSAQSDRARDGRSKQPDSPAAQPLEASGSPSNSKVSPSEKTARRKKSNFNGAKP